MMAEWFSRSCLRDDRTNGHWAVVAGNTGCGKTHASKRVHEFISAHQISAWHKGWLGQVNHIPAPVMLCWERWADAPDDDWTELVAREIRPARMVVIDDLGAETDRYKSGVPIARLKTLLDVCERKWVFITTNLPKTEWKKKWDQRVADRLWPARYLGLFEVPSYRQRATND